MLITRPVGGGRASGLRRRTHRGSVNVRLVPRDERKRTNEQIAMALRRELSGLPGVIVRARAVGRQLPARCASWAAATTRRLALEIRGHDLDDARRLAQDAKTLMDTTPGIADSRLGARTRAGPSSPSASIATRRPCSA